MHPKTPNDPTFSLDDNGKPVKKAYGKKKGKKPPPKAKEIPQFNGIEMPEHGWDIRLPNNVDSEDPTAIFLLFFNDNILSVMAGNTNAYAASKYAENNIAAFARPWHDTTIAELRTFLVVRIYIGLESSESILIKTYWR